MTQFTPAMDQALAGPNPLIFGAIEIVLPNHTIRLLDGSGTVAFGDKVFTGQDATYGTLFSMEDLADGTGDEAPAIQITLAPASNAAAADLASASHQGAPVTIWLGVVDPATGHVVADPLAIFRGVVDVPVLRNGANSRLLEIEVSSAFEAFFFNDDGARLSDQFHQYCWPGEAGLAQATGVLQHIYWGSSAPSGVSR